MLVLQCDAAELGTCGLAGTYRTKSCVVVHLKQGKEPWVPNRVDMSPATAREARRGPSSGCRCGAEETPPEQGVSIQGVLQLRTPEAGLSTQKVNPCDMCGLVLKGMLHMAEHQGTHTRHKPYKFEVCGKGFLLSANSRQHEEHSGEKTITCRKCCKDIMDSHYLLQASHSEGEPCRSPGHGESP